MDENLIIEEGKDGIFKGRNIYKHPSYGMLSFTRTTSNKAKPLFGSSIKHKDTIVMRVAHGKMERKINNDWYYAESPIVEVEMSQSQFAEAITSLNMGDGVPCTIKLTERDGKIPECNFNNKVEQFSSEFSVQLEDVQKGLDEAISEMTELFDSKKNLNKADRERVLSILKTARMNVGSNANFVFNCFTEQMEKTVKEAKGEIEAFCQNKLNSIAHAAIVEHKEEFAKLEKPIDFE